MRSVPLRAPPMYRPPPLVAAPPPDPKGPTVTSLLTDTAARRPDVDRRVIIGGVDTHLDTHVAAALDARGVELGTRSFPADPSGYRSLLAWLRSLGPVERIGVEGTGAYGVGLARYLARQGVAVVEVDRPNRQQRRKVGKSDPLDALAAARAALSGAASGQAKGRDGAVEAIRVLRVARRSAAHDRVRAISQLRAVVATSPDQLRESLRHLPRARLVSTCGALRPGAEIDVLSATKHALRELARRVQRLEEELVRLDDVLEPLVVAAAPALVALHALGPETVGALLVAAGDNPGRIRTEAAFAQLCGVAPLPASSGRVVRHRLNRGGDRSANSALWRIVLIRMRTDERTRAYVARRTTEGLSKLEIMRCLKRFVAREVFAHLPSTLERRATTELLGEPLVAQELGTPGVLGAGAKEAGQVVLGRERTVPAQREELSALAGRVLGQAEGAHNGDVAGTDQVAIEA